MRLIEWPRFLEEASPLGGGPSAVTVGVFDGVHRGHKALIERVVARKDRAVPALVTFRHSRFKKKRGGEYPGDILSFRQKTAAFESLGISAVVVIEFSESFRQMTGEDFLRILCEKGGMSFLAVGNNFRCGYQQNTDAPAIQEFCARRGIPTDIMEALTEGASPISSSRIRAAIARGNLECAAEMLGHPFIVDLAGVPAVFSCGETVYDIAGEGRILPPPGRYNALLFGKGRGRNTEKPSEILVENGTLRISGVSSARPSPEFAEFLP